jgi:hypothetical protein
LIEVGYGGLMKKGPSPGFVGGWLEFFSFSFFSFFADYGGP